MKQAQHPFGRHALRRYAWSPETLVGVLLVAVGWICLWSFEIYWNPLAFFALWTGAALVMWGISGSYPGVRTHALLASMSIPFWWYFELMNARVENWAYVGDHLYSPVAYAALSSLAFATVVPAISAALGMLAGFTGWSAAPAIPARGRRLGWKLVLGGAVAQAGVLALPEFLYPFVWIGPFLILDGLVAYVRGDSMTAELLEGSWRRAVLVGMAGLLCGFLWEFWNYYSFPSWTYHIPYLGFLPVFEMPVLGYGGYVPFAWTTTRLVDLFRIPTGWRRS